MVTIKEIEYELKESDLGEFLALELIAEITAIREKKGMSQRKLAELSNVSQKTISQLENGVNIPNLATIGKLMKALGCTPKITFEYK